MPEELEVKNVIIELISSVEFLDEAYWKAYDIHDVDKQQAIEVDTAGYITRNLLNGDYLRKVISFEERLNGSLEPIYNGYLPIGTPRETGGPPELKALKKCCRALRLLAS